MTSPSPGERKALFYFGVVEAGTIAGENTAQIWQRIRDAAAAQGLSSPGITIQQVNQLRASANLIKAATGRLGKGYGPSPIEGSMIGEAPWARPLNQRQATQMWQARFEHTFIEGGEQSTHWRTVTFTNELPGSVEEFNQAIFDDAAGMADAYGIEHVGIGSISLLAV